MARHHTGRVCSTNGCSTPLGDVTGRTVIDLGCGEGRFSRMLAERSALVTGVDLCRPFIEYAKTHRVGGESYLIGDMEDLHDVASAEYDLAVSYVTLVDVPNMQSAVGEAFRVLRPSGRFRRLQSPSDDLSESWLDHAGRPEAPSPARLLLRRGSAHHPPAGEPVFGELSPNVVGAHSHVSGRWVRSRRPPRSRRRPRSKQGSTRLSAITCVFPISSSTFCANPDRIPCTSADSTPARNQKGRRGVLYK